MKRRSLLQSIGAGIVAGLAAVFAPASVIAAVHPAVDYKKAFKTRVLELVTGGYELPLAVPKLAAWRAGGIPDTELAIVIVSEFSIKLWHSVPLRHGYTADRDTEKGLDEFMQFLEAIPGFTTWEKLYDAQQTDQITKLFLLSRTAYGIGGVEHSVATLETEQNTGEYMPSPGAAKGRGVSLGWFPGALPPADWL